jgi:predicted TIM-barrel fold metal-dependent hydrolase
MKIIDSHIHFIEGFNEHFNVLAKQAGHENSEAHLRETFTKLNIEKAIVMGNFGVDPDKNIFADIFCYAVGINYMDKKELTKKENLIMLEENLKRNNCVGVKLYPGYTHDYIYQKYYGGIYELVEKYDKAVAIHTGITASNMGILKYSHPLVVDETAVNYPRTKFVMCHIGYPWLADMEAVLEKNDNVYGDISGLIEGRFEIESFFKEKIDFINEVKKWISILDRYDKLMYGTDWPLTNMEFYINVIKRLIPEEHWDKVFYENAKRIYRM